MGFGFSGFDFWGDGHHADLYKDRPENLSKKFHTIPKQKPIFSFHNCIYFATWIDTTRYTPE
jgi:hypothetical protein